MQITSAAPAASGAPNHPKVWQKPDPRPDENLVIAHARTSRQRCVSRLAATFRIDSHDGCSAVDQEIGNDT